MALDIPLLKKICEIAGAPGFEKRIRDLILEEIRDIVDEVRINNMGNVLCDQKGKRAKEGDDRGAYG